MGFSAGDYTESLQFGYVNPGRAVWTLNIAVVNVSSRK